MADKTEAARLHSWIHGRSVEGKGPICEVVNAWTGAPVAHIPAAGGALVEEAVASAVKAQAAQRGTARAERAAWLAAAAIEIEKDRDLLTELSIAHIGKPRRAAAFEVGRTTAFIRACERQIHSFDGEVVPLDSAPAGKGLFGFSKRVPYGVIAAVTPFNAPANLLMQKVAPALVTGNAVVVKPSPEGAAVALALAEAFARAGLPEGLFNVVLGERDEALALAAHRDVALLTMTGGTAAGEALARAAGAKPFLGEMGGNSANIVCADADVDDAVRRITPSAFEASGQQCISTQRIILERPIAAAFLEAFTAAAAAMKAGDPSSPDSDLGPVVHARAADRIEAMIEDARERGAKVLGGPAREGCLIRPTIVVDPPRDARVVQEEIFGPVAVVLTVDSLEEAIACANDCDFGLQASCFTASLDTALRVSDALRVGSVWINEGSRFRLDNYPFGGFGRSGVGREGVRYAMEAYTTWKFTGIRLPARG